MRGGGCCPQSGRCKGPGVGVWKGCAVKEGMEAPGSVATWGPSTGDAVDRKKRASGSQRIHSQEGGPWDPLVTAEQSSELHRLRDITGKGAVCKCPRVSLAENHHPCPSHQESLSVQKRQLGQQ